MSAERTTAVAVGFADGLRTHGARPCLVAGGRTLTYDEVADRVDAVRRRLGSERRLVLLEASPGVDQVVTYLAALAGRHPVLVTAPGTAAALAEAWDPDVVAAPGGSGDWVLDERRPGTTHTLHPDLALLLSTSGSTGSPKLVRLSAANLDANAVAVADSLGLTSADVGITALPLSYCYGLSVLHSHLARGAAVVLTGLSVVDPCFRGLLREHGVSSLAGVPHTFDLLERSGFADLDLPRLRLVTQAGGRMHPDRVRHWAHVGLRHGWDLVVMYGQTEATARMAYLPPSLTLDHPGSVGVPVDGGSFTIERNGEGEGGVGQDGVGQDGVGAVVYRGPNVMLGYAHGPADLALGRTVDALPTGDLGRLTPEGLLEITGRAGCFVKPFGLRIDLARVDALLADQGLTACTTGDDDGLRVVVEACAHPGTVRAWLASELGLPGRAVEVVAVDALPRTVSGKPDRRAAAALAQGGKAGDRLDDGRLDTSPDTSRYDSRYGPGDGSGDGPGDDSGDVAGLLRIYAETLDVEPTPDDSFVGLGGDSLSYVAASVRLERALGTLPDGWHLLSIADLAALALPPAERRSSSGWARVETGVVLRAAAIVAVVGTHSLLLDVRGGAHLLLGVAGYNLARFGLHGDSARERATRLLRATARIAVPSMLWIAAVAALTGAYRPGTALLLNGATGPDTWGPDWHFWYVEALVHILLAVTALAALPVVARLHRTAPFALAAALAGVGLLARFGVVHVDTGPERGTPQFVAWVLALGWAAAVAHRPWQRLVVSAAVLAAVPGFFDADPARDAVLGLGLLALVWVPVVRLPRRVVPVVATLAASSLAIYLTQWQVFPLLRDTSPLLATLACLAVGVALQTCCGRLARLVRRARRPGGSAATGQAGAHGPDQAPMVAASMTNR